MLVALRDVEAGVAHVGALLGGDDVERLLGQVAAQVDRHPAAVGVARDLDAARGDVVDVARAPVLEVRQAYVRGGAGEKPQGGPRAGPGPPSPRRGGLPGPRP